MPRVTWRASERFLRDHAQAFSTLQVMAEREIQFLQRRVRSQQDWLSLYDRVEGLQGDTVIELEVGSGPRILAHIDGSTVTFVAFGKHEITRRYVRGRTLEHDLENSVELPSAFRLSNKNRLFPPVDANVPVSLTPWGAEMGRPSTRKSPNGSRARSMVSSKGSGSSTPGLEGNYSTRPELRDYYDLTIWIDAPRDVRLRRGVERDGEHSRSRLLNEWMPEEDRYMEACRPAEKANFVIDGTTL